jgi:hypothetical protein
MVMPFHHPSKVIGFHSCDKNVGMRIIRGEDQLKPSENSWDWLGHGIYFWEQNPRRALEYAIEAAMKKQFFAGDIKTPFIIGAFIQLGNCLNLIEGNSIKVLEDTYSNLEKMYKGYGKPLPQNHGANRKLDCTVFNHLHKSRNPGSDQPYDTIRCAFAEGNPLYPGANFTSRLHTEICVLNSSMIHGYFLPRPLEKYNPYLRSEFHIP